MAVSLDALPEPVLCELLSRLDVVSLGRLAQCAWRYARLLLFGATRMAIWRALLERDFDWPLAAGADARAFYKRLHADDGALVVRRRGSHRLVDVRSDEAGARIVASWRDGDTRMYSTATALPDAGWSMELPLNDSSRRRTEVVWSRGGERLASSSIEQPHPYPHIVVSNARTGAPDVWLNARLPHCCVDHIRWSADDCLVGADVHCNESYVNEVRVWDARTGALLLRAAGVSFDFGAGAAAADTLVIERERGDGTWIYRGQRSSVAGSLVSFVPQHRLGLGGAAAAVPDIDVDVAMYLSCGTRVHGICHVTPNDAVAANLVDEFNAGVTVCAAWRADTGRLLWRASHTLNVVDECAIAVQHGRGRAPWRRGSVATLHADGAVLVRCEDSGALRWRRAILPSEDNHVVGTTVAWSPDNVRLVAAKWRNIYIWDETTGAMLARIDLTRNRMGADIDFCTVMGFCGDARLLLKRARSFSLCSVLALERRYANNTPTCMSMSLD